ncbi:MAG: ATP-dependent Clp protease adaptor protein ClpS [Alphaproteobacteria bacterium]|jgi:ATP-dependent Clp protease adaptor protein ClpS
MYNPVRTQIWGTKPDGDVSLLQRTKSSVKRPSMYKVILLNDDYTPMDFVTHILERFFNKSIEESIKIMLQIHNDGSALCGVYTLEVAEAKSTAVMEYAQVNGHPLECTTEKE